MALNHPPFRESDWSRSDLNMLISAVFSAVLNKKVLLFGSDVKKWLDRPERLSLQRADCTTLKATGLLSCL